MNIISLIEKVSNDFNEKFKTNIDFYNLEEKIESIGDGFTVTLYQQYIETLDYEFMQSNERKERYGVKEILEKNLLTKFGWVTFKYRIYIDKKSGERYSFIRELLNIKPYQRISLEAEYEIVKYAEDNNMSQAAKHAIRNTIISRSTVQKKCLSFKGDINRKINKTDNTPKTLFIEMDEVHTNLQNKYTFGPARNHVCPCAVVHEGHKEEFTKRKELKNVKNFATTEPYRYLWNEIYSYCEQRYDLEKVECLFISGDGTPGIKAFDDVFPNGIYVLDPFHYKRKGLAPIFKRDHELFEKADLYLRNDRIDEFKELVQEQIKKYPVQEKMMLKKQEYLINNIEGIKNQKHEMYTCPCSMEGRVSNCYAKYLTSTPHAFSMKGLKNRLKLLVLNADKIELSFEDFLNLKFGMDVTEILKQRDKQLGIKFDMKLLRPNNQSKYADILVLVPRFDNVKTQDYLEKIIRPLPF